jgi:hypothetical protein
MFRTPNAGESPALSIRARTCTPDMVGKTDRGAAPDRSPETTQLLQELAPILFVARRQYKNVHGPDETMYQPNEGVAGGFIPPAAEFVPLSSCDRRRFGIAISMKEVDYRWVVIPSMIFADCRRIAGNLRESAGRKAHTVRKFCLS